MVCFPGDEIVLEMMFRASRNAAPQALPGAAFRASCGVCTGARAIRQREN